MKYFKSKASGAFEYIEGDLFYKISHFNDIPPFFMSIVSDSDQWNFISTTGGLTAGRINSENALFPYYTEDKISENSETTGSKTLIRIKHEDRLILWEPLSDLYPGLCSIERNLYKNTTGNIVIFEEIFLDLNLTFRYSWTSSDRFGIVRKASLCNRSSVRLNLEILDGIQNILPYGTTVQVQNQLSNLLNAYKKNEQDIETGLGLFTLSSILTDQAEPSEALMASTVWNAGLEYEKILLSSQQISCFRKNESLKNEVDVRGQRGSYFINSKIILNPEEKKEWYICADLNQDYSDIVVLQEQLKNKKDLINYLIKDIHRGTENLKRLVASSDGAQLTQDKKCAMHHFSNTLFNIMRGGVFFENYTIPLDDFNQFLLEQNKLVYSQWQNTQNSFDRKLSVFSFKKQIKELGNKDMERLSLEYLPLTFSRRHGDPSRPWNNFSIDIKNEAGEKRLNYEGNWRDIFQNWEALILSFPGFIESIITKFVNASTADGYNPYRIIRNGFEWEEPEEGNPWANIGYWGDHQGIYLLKLLEWGDRFYAGMIDDMLEREIYVYADVPYRIKDYSQIKENSQDTILFMDEKNRQIKERVKNLGSDGKLLMKEGKIVYVSFVEKLLVTVCAKLVNFVPGGGIWMNTQRPEWNDANNALVGNGLSVVSLCYLRRFFLYLNDLFERNKEKTFSLSETLSDLLFQIQEILGNMNEENGKGKNLTPEVLKGFVDAMGKAGSDYRHKIYLHEMGNKKKVSSKNLLEFSITVLAALDQTIIANRKDEGLYHSYNLIEGIKSDALEIKPLYEMLEGQVAVLSSGALAGQEVIHLLDSMRKSLLYREDQKSYMLYPYRKFPFFLEKNVVKPQALSSSKLVSLMEAKNDSRIISRDIKGNYHFNGHFRNNKDLLEALRLLAAETFYSSAVDADKDLLLEVFEKTFDHKSFTGRSGTFFAYEGLGSIYWHMVSKLLLAVQENCFKAFVDESPEITKALCLKYYEIREGLGFNKEPDEYGAFPMDPYSHSPWGAGAKQPGMTGQVKEELITRLGELGLCVKDQQITITPLLLRSREFLEEGKPFDYYNLEGVKKDIFVKKGGLAFLYCQVPFVYEISNFDGLEVQYESGEIENLKGLTLDFRQSQMIFNRTGKVRSVHVFFSSERGQTLLV